MITVRLPSSLQVGTSDIVEIEEPVTSIDALITVLDRRIPGLREQLDDSVFNFAVNDELLLQNSRAHALCDGDRVEIVPTISGG